MDNQSTLRIIGPSKLVILRTLPLLYRFKPFHWRVQDPYGRKNYISYASWWFWGGWTTHFFTHKIHEADCFFCYSFPWFSWFINKKKHPANPFIWLNYYEVQKLKESAFVGRIPLLNQNLGFTTITDTHENPLVRWVSVRSAVATTSAANRGEQWDSTRGS